MNQYDQRQLESMRHQLQAFRTGAIDLSWLISSLETLRHALREVPEDWLDQFWSKWGVLEEIFSLSIVREQQLSEADRDEVARVVADLDALISNLLSASEAGG